LKKLITYIALFLLTGLLACDKLMNKSPIINGVHAIRTELGSSDTTTVWVDAEDPDGDILSYTWGSDNYGSFSSTIGKSVVWMAPQLSGVYTLSVTVRDEDGAEVRNHVKITVIGEETPIVQITEPKNNAVIPGLGIFEIRAIAEHRLGIGKVDFYIDDELKGTDTQAPYSCSWTLNGISGEKKITVRAYRFGDQTNPGTDSVRVTIEGVSEYPL